MGSVSQQLAKVGICADQQNKFLIISDQIYAKQKELKDNNVQRFIGGLNLDQQKLNSCLGSSQTKFHLDEDVQLARSLGFKGTPTIIMNGFISSMQEIDQKLAQLRK